MIFRVFNFRIAHDAIQKYFNNENFAIYGIELHNTNFIRQERLLVLSKNSPSRLVLQLRNRYVHIN